MFRKSIRKILTDCSWKRLLIKARNIEAVKSRLTGAGYAPRMSGEGILEVINEKAIKCPEDIAVLLVNVNLPPAMLMVEEEDLESYFLRVTGMNGGVK